jgi:hypothetical protein
LHKSCSDPYQNALPLLRAVHDADAKACRRRTGGGRTTRAASCFESRSDAPHREEEGVIQFSLSMRKQLRKQLARLASDADMTMRAFVLNALKEKGLSVRDDDLIDLRKERR